MKPHDAEDPRHAHAKQASAWRTTQFLTIVIALLVLVIFAVLIKQFGAD